MKATLRPLGQRTPCTPLRIAVAQVGVIKVDVGNLFRRDAFGSLRDALPNVFRNDSTRIGTDIADHCARQLPSVIFRPSTSQAGNRCTQPRQRIWVARSNQVAGARVQNRLEIPSMCG